MTATDLQTLRVSSVRRLAYWLEPRWRDPGWLAFALNRLTGHILILYLVLHMVVLSQLLDGAQGWNRLLGLFGSRPFLVGDTLLIAALTFGIGARHATLLILLVLGATTVVTALAGWAILT